MQKRIGKVDDVAKRLEIDRQRTYQLTREGAFDGVVIKLGERQYRYNLDALEVWIERGGNAKGKEIQNND